jgi:hypothetical protein
VPVKLGRLALASSSLLIVLNLPALGRQINPAFNPANFTDLNPNVNPYFPLDQDPLYYSSDDETETVEFLGMDGDAACPAMMVLGKQAFVVHDQVSDDSGLIEDTCDWYLPDNQGNVWYVGESATQLPSGLHEGSWTAGVGSPPAQPGIIMEANPRNGDKYRQEFAPGVAEDVGQVISRRQSVSVQAGDFHNCIETMDSSRLAPGDREHKYYCPGVGLVLEVTPKGGRGRNELVPPPG